MNTLHCVKTGNPCGTDTWKRGYECPCKYCQRWKGREEGRLLGLEQAAEAVWPSDWEVADVKARIRALKVKP